MKIEEVLRTVNQMTTDGIIERYAIGDAVGATFYLEPVSSLDVDIFIELHTAPGAQLVTLEPVFDYLCARGGRMEGEHIVISDWPCNFFHRRDLWQKRL